MRTAILVPFLYFLANTSLAEGVAGQLRSKLDYLSRTECYVTEFDQSSWHRLDDPTLTDGNDPIRACVLAYEPNSSDVVKIRLPGKLVQLQLSSTNKRGDPTFVSADKMVSVKLQTIKVDDSRTESSESCCGSYTTAWLVITIDGRVSRYRVFNYQGG